MTTTEPTAQSQAAVQPAAQPQPTALVTGSTSGIGAAIARRLASDGHRVVATGRDHDRGAQVVDDIVSAGGTAEFLASDLTDGPDGLRAFAEQVLAAIDGRLDVLVHNAAVCPAVDTLQLSDEQLEATLAVNVRAPHVLTAALAPSMITAGTGSIVVIGSWMAGIGHPFVGLYSATKAAEAQLARSWAAEFGGAGVRVNTVAPGATRTPINADADDAVSAMTATTPAGRPGVPEEIAAAVAWLVSDQAEYVHGAVIAVDGGITAARTG